MQLLEEVIQNGVDAEIDLSWFQLEGEANSYFHKKGRPLRFAFTGVTNDVLEVSLKGTAYVVAVYIRSTRRLYRCAGSLELQWAMVRAAMIKVLGKDIDIIN